MEFKNVPIECAARRAVDFCAVVSEWLSEGSVRSCSPDVVDAASYAFHSVPGVPSALDVVTVRTVARWPDQTFAVVRLDELQRLFAFSEFFESNNASRVVFVTEERSSNAVVVAVMIVWLLTLVFVLSERCWRRVPCARRPSYRAVAPELPLGSA